MRILPISNRPQNGAWIAALRNGGYGLHREPRSALCGLARNWSMMAGLAAALLMSGCMVGDFGGNSIYTDFHYSYDLAPGGRVSVDNFNGSVEISGWDEAKVDVAGTRYASSEERRDEIRIEAQSSPSQLTLRTTRPSGGFSFGNMGARYTIRVPRGARVDEITTSNGSIRISDVAAASHLKSSNGSIRVENVAGSVDARTSNSSIEMEAVRGDVTMRSSNGRLRAEDIEGNCDAQTSNNSISIRLKHAPGTPIRLITSNGSVDLALEQAPKSGIRMESRNGSLNIHLPSGAGAHLEAETSNSGISSDFDLTRGGERGKNHLDGDIGGGGPTIEMKTSNSHIRIAKGSGD